MRLSAFLLLLSTAAPAFAQSPPAGHTINVSGHGKVTVPPDTARIHYWVRGEGTTPDDATRAMVGLQNQVEGGLKRLLGPSAAFSNSDLLVIQVRDPKCSDQSQPRLSQAECAVIGYLARSEGDVSSPAIEKAGTAVGLASRLGASDARLQGFELRDTTAARRSAMTSAVADAREQAGILAAAAGGHLGPVLDIRYGSYSSGPVFISGSQIQTVSAPPALPPLPPVQIDITPRPQEITADVSISYALLP